MRTWWGEENMLKRGIGGEGELSSTPLFVYPLHDWDNTSCLGMKNVERISKPLRENSLNTKINNHDMDAGSRFTTRLRKYLWLPFIPLKTSNVEALSWPGNWLLKFTVLVFMKTYGSYLYKCQRHPSKVALKICVHPRVLKLPLVPFHDNAQIPSSLNYVLGGPYA